MNPKTFRALAVKYAKTFFEDAEADCDFEQDGARWFFTIRMLDPDAFPEVHVKCIHHNKMYKAFIYPKQDYLCDIY
jgi:hypothetical protein